MRGMTWVRIKELKSGDSAIGSRALKTGAVRQMAAE